MSEISFISTLYERSFSKNQTFPDRQLGVDFIEGVFHLLFIPNKSKQNTKESLHKDYDNLRDTFSALIYDIIHDEASVEKNTVDFFNALPGLYQQLLMDAAAIVNFDPAANSIEEVFIAYPGFFATVVYRLSHQLYIQDVPTLPRLLSEYAHSKTGIDTDVNKNGFTQNQAIAKNAGILVKSNYDYIKPEHINSLEMGYRGTFLEGKLFVDADYYFNVYKSFIGQVELTKPNSGTIGLNDSTAYEAYNKTQSKIYRMWTNSTSIVSNQGASLGISYNIYKKYQVSGNASFATLVKISEADALIPAFNTPKVSPNFS
jgi:hypothetical protein